MSRKNKNVLWLLLLILLGAGGFLVWKYLLPMTGLSKTVVQIEMKIPEIGSIQMTKNFGLVPVTQFGIVLKEGLTISDAEKIASETGGIITGELGIINFYQLEIKSSTAETFEQVLAKLQKKPGVELVSPNGLIVPDGFDESAGTCNPLDDPMYKDTAHGRNYSMIGLKNAYDYIKASGLKLNAVKVGILDDHLYKPCDELGGISDVSTTDKGDYNNEPEKDEKGNVIDGGLSHGTMVNQIIGANAENGGVTGVASPLGDKLTMQTTNIYKDKTYVISTPDPEDPSKVVDKRATYTHTVLKAMLEQIKNGATVINCSFGPAKYTAKNAFETQLYEKFYAKINEKYPKVVIIGSAGNSNTALDGTNGSNKGQKADNLITVGALDPDGKKSSYSNYATAHSEVTLSAPADNMIHGTDKSGNPILASGTSFAAPQVAGAVALLQSINPDLTAYEIKTILVITADDEIDGRNGKTTIPSGMGVGMLRIDNAVLKVINDMRAKLGLPLLTSNSLVEMNTVMLSYKGGPETYTITAGIKAISGKSTNLSINVSGNDYSIGGNRQQTLSTPGEISWSLTTTKPDNKFTVKVSRSDTKSCAWVVIESIELTGIWDVRGVITSAKLDASLGPAQDMGKNIYGGNESEMKEGQRDAEKSMIGKANPLGTIDVESWKMRGCKFTKEGTTIVITPPGADNPKALGSMIYYIEKIEGNIFTGKAIARNHFGGRDNEMHYDITGTKKE